MTVRRFLPTVGAVGAVGAAALAACGLALLPGGAALAAPSSPSPTPSGQMVASAGTSFLTAVTVREEDRVSVPASTGDYLYWAFEAAAGDTPTVALTVTLPPSQGRHGDSAWQVDVFDGLRRRQACTAGAQSPVAGKTASAVTLGCTLRQVRGWAEPWSADPLPGLYYVRLFAPALPDADFGQPIQADLSLSVERSDDPTPEGGELAAPLMPAQKAGTVRAGATSGGPSPSPSDDSLFDVDMTGWIPDASSRWVWTVAGGGVAAVTGILGFSWVRRRRLLP